MSVSTLKKLNKLQLILQKLSSAVVAFSGGVDSTFLLKIAKDVLKDKILAVTAVFPFFPKAEIKEAKKIAKFLKVKLKIIKVNQLLDKNFIKNGPDRCYFCKKKLFSSLKKIAMKENLKYVIEGSNVCDAFDYRPGTKAIKENRILSPLKEAGLKKEEIRLLSKKLGLFTWNKPAFSCLVTRIPYGVKISKEILKKIERAEDFLKKLGFKIFRVRHHQEIARIEIKPEEFEKIMTDKKRKLINKAFKKIGYKFIALDLEGYRLGSLNEVLELK